MFAPIGKSCGRRKHTFSKIKATLKDYNFTKITMDTFSPVSFMDNIKFGSELNSQIGTDNTQLDSTITGEIENQSTIQKHIYEDSWQRFINRVAEDLEKLRLRNHHYLFIDGIDTRPQDISYDEYKQCIYPLVRAVYDLNNDILSRIKDRKKGRLQIVLLTRLDIFLNAGLSNAGSKISDNSAFLNWSMSNERDYKKTELYALVNNMLQAGSSENNVTWDKYFNFQINRGNQRFESFVYFLRLTTSRPRDFVKILKILKERCSASSIENPTAEIIESDMFQRGYSTYFADTFRTALGFYYTEQEIKILFDFIKSFKRRNFTYAQYEEIWNSFSDRTVLQDLFYTSYDLLELLFNFNLIAIKENETFYRWKYRECTVANYDYSLEKNNITSDTKFIFTWAAEKEFGLYLRRF